MTDHTIDPEKDREPVRGADGMADHGAPRRRHP